MVRSVCDKSCGYFAYPQAVNGMDAFAHPLWPRHCTEICRYAAHLAAFDLAERSGAAIPVVIHLLATVLAVRLTLLR